MWVKPLFATIRGAAVEVDEVAPELEKRSWTATSLCRGTGRRGAVVAAVEHPVAGNAPLIG